MFDVITIGSSTVDAFALADSELIEIKSQDEEEDLIAFPLGSKIPIKQLHYDTGGNGVNTGIGISRLGLNTAFLGKVGTDGNGEMIMEKLKQEKVCFIGARGEKSGFSILLYSELAQDRALLGYKGCNNDLKFEELDSSKLETKWFYLSTMLKDSFKTMEKIAENAKVKGIKIAFNPSSSITRKGIDFIRSILDKTDVLIINDEEAEDLVGKGAPEENLRKLHAMGIEMIIITMGAKGVIATNGSLLYKAPARSCQIVEKTGAGDACSSGFLAGIVHGKDFESCLRMGMLNAESVLCHYGAQNKLLTKEEMESKLQADDREIVKIGL